MEDVKMFEGKKILITGGTGSLGQALTSRLLENDVDTIRILSRNEEKQIKMRHLIKVNYQIFMKNLSYF